MGDAVRVVFDGIVQQRGARHVRVGDAVMADDADRHSQQVVRIRFALLVLCVTAYSVGTADSCHTG